MRKYRKREHVENYLRATFEGNPLFDQVYLEHNALPELSIDQIDPSVDFLGHRIPFPLMINAMTGGTNFTEEINRDLSHIAKRHELPMAVGSEMVAIDEMDARHSFQVVREAMGDSGIIISNINGFATVEEAKIAVDLVEADGIQIHINPAQELAMEEGDRDFRGVTDNIEAIVNGLDIPVIVKEVGFGLSADVIQRLYEIGVRYVDISGFGGTNFFEVENLRCPSLDVTDLFEWGIPTAKSLIDAKALGYEDLNIIAAGGLRDAMDVTKALVLGADMTAMSGEILSYLMHGGKEYAMDFIASLILKTKMLMLLVGAKDIEELQNKPYKLTGRLKDLIE